VRGIVFTSRQTDIKTRGEHRTIEGTHYPTEIAIFSATLHMKAMALLWSNWHRFNPLLTDTVKSAIWCADKGEIRPSLEISGTKSIPVRAAARAWGKETRKFMSMR
jgi:hypothetical protein